jgi:type II secretory pathway predicted ATPase ExeA
MSDLDWLKRASDEVDASRKKTAAPPDLGPLTYEPHFGLREKAFSLLPSTRFFSRNSSNGAAFDELLAGIRRREGILALTGEVGTGKTTLCRAVLAALDRKTFAAFVPDPIVSREDLLMTLLVDFGVVSVDEIRAGHLRDASRTELAYPLHDFLTALQPLNGFAVVMIDEAQDIPNALLEEIRILSDMENGQKLLQLLLIGQPELEDRLATPEMRQLTQRLTVRCELEPLGREEVMPYITHRLSVAGRSEPLFHDGDSDLIWKTSEGIPRVINLLCDRALTRAARAGAAMVTTEQIVDAAKDLKLPARRSAASPSKSPATASSVSPRPVPPKDDKPVRQGLPADYRMRHDAHYVEELTSKRDVSPVASNASVEEKPPTVGPSSRTLSPFNSELDEASKAELLEFERTADEAGAARRHRAKLAVMFTVVMIAAAAGTWMYLSSSVRPRQEPRVQSTRTAPATSAAPQPLPAGAGSASRGANEPPVAAREPELLAEVIGRKGFAIQMATFSSAQRAAQSVEQLRASGYKAYERRVALRDGSGAYVVYLGPYADFESASVELSRARQLPDYTAGRIVPLE